MKKNLKENSKRKVQNSESIFDAYETHSGCIDCDNSTDLKMKTTTPDRKSKSKKMMSESRKNTNNFTKLLLATVIILTTTNEKYHSVHASSYGSWHNKGWYDFKTYSPITWGIESYPHNRIISYEKLCTAFNRAFDAWSTIANLTFSEINYGQSLVCNTNYNLRYNQYRRPVIKIKFVRRNHGDNYPFDGRSNQLAHAFYPTNSDALGGDMHFDLDEIWTLDENRWEGTDLFYVAVHELGHALGLKHNSDPNSIMYVRYKSLDTSVDDLFTYDDRLNIQKLYGVKNYEQRYQTNRIREEMENHKSVRVNKAKSGRPSTYEVIDRKYANRKKYLNQQRRRKYLRKKNLSYKRKLCTEDIYDAAGFVDNKFWVFMDKTIYIISPGGKNHQVASIKKYLPDFRSGSRVNDFFETQPFYDKYGNYIDGYIYLISGEMMYKFTKHEDYKQRRLVAGWPKNMRDLYKNGDTQIVGSTFWEKSKTVYLFDSNDQYYRFMPATDTFIRQVTNKNRGYRRTYPMSFRKVLGLGF